MASEQRQPPIELQDMHTAQCSCSSPDEETRSLLDSSSPKGSDAGVLRKLGASFFLFGLINNVLYVIILSAALDLVPPSTPKGIIAFCNIAPALVAKVGWPYILKGRIRYTKRLIGCCVLSFCGMLVVGFFEGLYMRLIGICLASFSSGLGELTFLQLSTTYSPSSVAGHSVGYFASGTGAAGLVGAFIWWEVRGLGVKVGIGMSSILPFVIPLTYFFLLPRSSAVGSHGESGSEGAYEPLPTVAEDDDEDASSAEVVTAAEFVVPIHHRDRGEESVSLSVKDKWHLARPLLLKYMLPLFCVYTFEYTINQGIAPTLVYDVPSPSQYPVISKIIHSIRDYYPFWQLVYQTSVFFSRSSISFGLPPLPRNLLSLPAFIQAGILVILALESALGMFEGGVGGERHGMGVSFWMVVGCIMVEGVCGGLAYVNVFYRINQDPPSSSPDASPERQRQEKEFKIGSIGFADSSGILIASLLAVPTEVGLCRIQSGRGKVLCKEL